MALALPSGKRVLDVTWGCVEGSLWWFTSGGHLCLLRCALCCGEGLPVPSHAILFFSCLGNAEHHRHKQASDVSASLLY